MKDFDRKDHLANERTFLAWIRTTLGLMAFGFVLVRFSLFTSELATLAGKTPPPQSSASLLGLLLIGVGSFLTLFAFWRYRNITKQITENTYAGSLLLDGVLTLFVFLLGVFLFIYLLV